MNNNEPATLFEVATNNRSNAHVLHLRFQGRSRDISLDTLGVDSTTPDGEIRAAVARFIEMPLTEFALTVVERHESGHITLRPEAVFG